VTTTVTPPIDLDDTPPPSTPPRSAPPFPVAAALFALGGFIAVAIGLTATRPAPESEPAPVHTPQIQIEQSPDGIGLNTTVTRDGRGEIVGVSTVVRSVNYQPVWCRLTVDGRVIEDQAVDGNPAVCVWFRDAA
jgi:hypothetical protein